MRIKNISIKMYHFPFNLLQKMIFITTFFFVRLCMEVTNLIIHSFNSCCNLLNCFSNKYIKAKASNCISGSQQKCKPSQIFDKSFNYSMLLPTSIIYMLVICVLLWNKWCKVISERFMWIGTVFFEQNTSFLPMFLFQNIKEKLYN